MMRRGTRRKIKKKNEIGKEIGRRTKKEKKEKGEGRKR